MALSIAWCQRAGYRQRVCLHASHPTPPHSSPSGCCLCAPCTPRAQSARTPPKDVLAARRWPATLPAQQPGPCERACLGRLEGVVGWELDVQKEDAARVGGACGRVGRGAEFGVLVAQQLPRTCVVRQLHRMHVQGATHKNKPWQEQRGCSRKGGSPARLLLILARRQAGAGDRKGRSGAPVGPMIVATHVYMSSPLGPAINQTTQSVRGERGLLARPCVHAAPAPPRHQIVVQALHWLPAEQSAGGSREISACARGGSAGRPGLGWCGAEGGMACTALPGELSPALPPPLWALGGPCYPPTPSGCAWPTPTAPARRVPTNLRAGEAGAATVLLYARLALRRRSCREPGANRSSAHHPGSSDRLITCCGGEA